MMPGKSLSPVFALFVIVLSAIFSVYMIHRISYAKGFVDGAQRSVQAHKVRRIPMLVRQAADIQPGGVTVLGDSIVELQKFSQLCGRDVFNAGVSDAKTMEVADMAPAVVMLARPAITVIAVGVNDADPDSPTSPADWADAYRRLLTDLKGQRLILVGIQPLERAKLSSLRRDEDRIEEQNDAIAQFAKEFGAILVAAPTDATGSTSDGIHLSAAGANRWQAAVERACPPPPIAR